MKLVPNKFEVKDYEPKYYVEIACWFQRRKRPIPHENELPKVGKIVVYNESLISCGFIFMTDTPICSIGNVISDPDVANTVRGESINYLINALCEEAKRLEYSGICAGASSDTLIKRYLHKGFEIFDRNITVMGRKI